MFDVQIRRVIDPALDRVAAAVAKTGVSANMVTWLGFLMGMAGAVCAGMSWFYPALALVAVNRICDGLDGCIARHNGKSDFGGFLDIALDMIFYSAVPFAFAVVNPANALPAAFLLFTFFGTGCTFLAYAIITAKRRITEDQEGKKSFFYSVGLIEGAETAVFLHVICLFPDYFPILAWVFGSLCCITTVIRLTQASFEFRDGTSSQNV